MIGFSYIYKSSDDIFSNTTHLSSMGLWDILGLVIFLWITLAFIFIIIPSIVIFYKHGKLQKEKLNKRKILTQILLQKEIEDEVEKEIQIEEDKKIK